VGFGYPSNLLKNLIFRQLILSFCPTFKDSMQARHIHFEPLQNIEDLRMHYAIDDITGSAFFE
jgi:hypothetical protein